MTLSRSEVFPRVVPFAIFMAFIGLEELLRNFAAKGFIAVLSPQTLCYLYPVKAVVVALAIIAILRRCPELKLSDLANTGRSFLSVLAGLTVFVLWINMDWSTGPSGTPVGFNPHLISENRYVIALLLVSRFFGAVIVVPVMEELFWRSFLIRYISNHDFLKVPLGHFTWPSFIVSSLLFGVEHHFFLAGCMAGVAYNLLLYRTRSIGQCILAHAVTNLALGIYVVATGKWYFW